MAYTDETIDTNLSNKQKSDLLSSLFKRFDILKNQRQFYHDMWDEITEFVLPNRGDFAYKRTTAGRRDRRLFDSTAIRANEQLAATLKEGIMPLYDMWGTINVRMPQLAQMDEIQRYLEVVNDIIYEVINNPSSHFHAQNHELFLDLCAYGTACMYIDSNERNQIRFKAIHLSEIYIAEDQSGMIDTVFREFDFTPRQAAQQWGLEKLSPSLQKKVAEIPDEKIKLLHVVRPNEDYDGVRVGALNLPFSSYYCEVETKHIIDVGGYHEMPYKITRWSKFIGEMYGRSPAWGAMPDIMMASALKSIIIKASQKAADPVYLLADDGVMLPLDTRPGGVNFGGVDPVTGRPRIQVLEHQGRFDVAYNLLESVRQDIRMSFYSDMLAERNTDRMTATAVNELRDEKLRSIGPQVGRIQSEYVGPLLQRVYGLLARNGQIPTLPDDLSDLIDQTGLDIDYSAPLFNTERRQEPIALQRTIGAVAPFLQTDPTIMDNFDADEIIRSVGEVFGTPATYFKSREVVAEERQERELQQQQLMQMQQQSVQAENMSKLAKSGVISEE